MILLHLKSALFKHFEFKSSVAVHNICRVSLHSYRNVKKNKFCGNCSSLLTKVQDKQHGYRQRKDGWMDGRMDGVMDGQRSFINRVPFG